MRDIGNLLDAVRLVHSVDESAWSRQDENQLMAWFTTYADDWLISQVRCHFTCAATSAQQRLHDA